MRTDTSRRLVALVQTGVVTRQQLVEAGADRTLFDREVRSGRWARPFPGVALTSPPPTPLHLARAALLAAGPASALTGLAACRVHGLRDVPEGGPVDVLVPVRQRLQVPPGVRLRRTQHLDDVEQRGPLRVVPSERAVVDAALRLPRLQDVRALLLAAVADHRVDLDRADALLARAPQRGSGHLRRALLDARRGAASAPEAEVVDLLLPVARRLRCQLRVNADVLCDGRLVARLDVVLPELGIGVEVDSLRHHGSSADLEATLRRHERLTALGLRLLHVTPWSVRGAPRELVARLLEAARQPSSLVPGVEIGRPGPLIDGA